MGRSNRPPLLSGTPGSFARLRRDAGRVWERTWLEGSRSALYAGSCNDMASVKVVTAARATKDTGADMKVKCKETARGGLAVNVIEC